MATFLILGSANSDPAERQTLLRVKGTWGALGVQYQGLGVIGVQYQGLGDIGGPRGPISGSRDRGDTRCSIPW